MSGTSWSVPFVVLLVLHWVSREALWQRATRKQGLVRFPPVLAIRLLYGLGVPMFGAGAAHVLAGPAPDRWLVLIFLGFLALLFLTWPGTITITDQGISQSAWFGIKTARLRWEQVESQIDMDFERTTYVYGKDGRTIRHTGFHVDPDGFKWELKRRSPVPLLDKALQPI